MSAAPSDGALRAGLDRLRGLVLERLVDILENGVPLQKPDPKTGVVAEVGRSPAPPAYLSAAIRFLKDNGVAVGSEAADDLEALLAELPALEEEDGEEDGEEDAAAEA